MLPPCCAPMFDSGQKFELKRHGFSHLMIQIIAQIFAKTYSDLLSFIHYCSQTPAGHTFLLVPLRNFVK